MKNQRLRWLGFACLAARFLAAGDQTPRLFLSAVDAQTWILLNSTGTLTLTTDSGRSERFLAHPFGGRAIRRLFWEESLSTLFAQSEENEIARSSDGGRTWQCISDTELEITTLRGRPGPAVFAEHGQMQLWLGGTHRIWRWIESDQRWNLAYEDPEHSSITSVAVSPLDAGLTLAGTSRGELIALRYDPESDRYRATKRDLGQHTITAIAFDPEQSDVWYVSAADEGVQERNGELHKTVDAGLTWTSVDLEGTRALAIHPTRSEWLLALNHDGLLVLDQRERSWLRIARSGHGVSDIVFVPTESGIRTLLAGDSALATKLLDRAASGEKCIPSFSPARFRLNRREHNLKLRVSYTRTPVQERRQCQASFSRGNTQSWLDVQTKSGDGDVTVDLHVSANTTSPPKTREGAVFVKVRIGPRGDFKEYKVPVEQSR